MKSVVDKVANTWGKLRIVVSYTDLPADVISWHQDPLTLSDDDLLEAINVDFVGSYHFIRASKEYMKKERYGNVVLISSSPTIYGESVGYRFILAKDLNRMTVRSLAEKMIREVGFPLVEWSC